jgi:hypothetical protein
MFLMVAIIIGVVMIVTSPELYASEPLPTKIVSGYDINTIQNDDAEMRKIQGMLEKRKLQPTLASTMSQVFIIPQPDMPNHFLTVKYPSKQYISYKTTHI